MLIDVKVPALAESIAEATLLDWHKQPGEPVKRGDNLIDIETDKVTLEVSALNDGVLSEVLKLSGELVESDEVIARIETDAQAPSTPGGPATPTAETAAPASANQAAAPAATPADQAAPTAEPPRTSPAVRNAVAAQQLDLGQIPMQTQAGRVTKEDVANHLAQRGDAPPADQQVPQTPAKVAQDAPDAAPARAPDSDAEPATGRKQERVPMTRLRKRAAQRLLGAQHENAILTTFNEVNMQPVMTVRARYKEEFEKQHGVRLGFMSFFTKAAVEALKKFPIINASVDGEDILYHQYFDIGIAVSAPRGLVVPIVRNAELLSLADIEGQIRELSGRARNNKLNLDDLTGGTFTITNGGVFGSLLSTPILNPPQSAILGMHKIQERPMAENGKILVRPMMYLALSYDHRIIDGSEAVQFLVSVKTQLEDPARMLLQL